MRAGPISPAVRLAPAHARCPPVIALRPAWLWTGTELVRAPTLVLEDDGTVSFDARGLPVEDLGGIVLPGLVNAHTHLELAGTPTPTGQGIVPWVGALRGGPPPSEGQARFGAAVAWTSGTALVGDITNTGLSRRALADGPVEGVVFDEVLGIDRVEVPDVPCLTPHAPHSTHPAIVRAAAARAAAANDSASWDGRGPAPARNAHPGNPETPSLPRWSLHCDEDPDERAFLLDHTGRWPAVMRALGRDLGAFPPTGRTPVAHLHDLGVLSERALLVHLTLTRGADLDTIAETGARAVLCVRSNQHITGALPDAPGLIARGVPIALGTDSLASCPDLDLLAEAAAARKAFPEVPSAVWARALTAGGAEALARGDHGRVVAGGRAPLLHVRLPDTSDPLATLLDGTRWQRQWVT